MKVKLVVVGGEVHPSQTKLELPFVLGRGREAEVSLNHALVSRRHCELYQARGRLRVRDLGSLNGTFVGSQRIQDAEIPPGELLTVGTVTFRAIYGDLAHNASVELSTSSDSLEPEEAFDRSIFEDLEVGESSTMSGDVASEPTRLGNSPSKADEAGQL